MAVFPCKMVYTVKRPYPLLVTSLFYNGLSNESNWRDFGFGGFKVNHVLMLDDGWYYPDYLLFDFAKDLFKKLSASPDYGPSLVEKSASIERELQELAARLGAKDYSNSSEKELLEDLHAFTAAFERYAPALGIFWLADLIEEYLRKALSGKFDEKQAEKHLSAITLPLEENYYKREIRAFLKLVAEFKKHGRWNEKLREKVARHHYDYSWLWARYGAAASIDEAGLAKRAEGKAEDDVERELKELENAAASQRLAYEQALAVLDSKDRHLAGVLQDFIFLRTHRTDVFNKTFHLIRNLLLKLAEFKGLSYGELLACTSSEVFGIRPAKDALAARQEAFGFVGCGGLVEVETGAGLAKLQDAYSDKHSSVAQVSGRVACAGKASGVCRLVLSKDDYPRFRKGDILVTPMTTPDMMLLMEKAAAFVTDEGGITCHAAIISRELGKPCVINTKRATSVFKDGDLLEVDATNGVVKKLGS